MTEAIEPLLSNLFTVHVNGPDSKRSRNDIAFDRITGIQSTRRATGFLRLTTYFKQNNADRIVLRRALHKDHFFYDWHKANNRNLADLRVVTIVQLDSKVRHPVNIWRYNDAWVETWRGPDFDANHSSIAYETITLGYRSFSWLDSKEK